MRLLLKVSFLLHYFDEKTTTNNLELCYYLYILETYVKLCTSLITIPKILANIS